MYTVVEAIIGMLLRRFYSTRQKSQESRLKRAVACRSRSLVASSRSRVQRLALWPIAEQTPSQAAGPTEDAREVKLFTFRISEIVALPPPKFLLLVCP